MSNLEKKIAAGALILAGLGVGSYGASRVIDNPRDLLGYAGTALALASVVYAGKELSYRQRIDNANNKILKQTKQLVPAQPVIDYTNISKHFRV